MLFNPSSPLWKAPQFIQELAKKNFCSIFSGKVSKLKNNSWFVQFFTWCVCNSYLCQTHFLLLFSLIVLFGAYSKILHGIKWSEQRVEKRPQGDNLKPLVINLKEEGHKKTFSFYSWFLAHFSFLAINENFGAIFIAISWQNILMSNHFASWKNCIITSWLAVNFNFVFLLWFFLLAKARFSSELSLHTSHIVCGTNETSHSAKKLYRNTHNKKKRLWRRSAIFHLPR